MQGESDLPDLNTLSEQGHQQAVVGAARLFEIFQARLRAGKGIVVLVSPRLRAMATMRAFLAKVREELQLSGRQLQSLLTVVIEPLASEMKMGELSNLTPEQMDEHQHRLWQRIHQGDATAKPNGGESFLMLIARRARLLKRLARLYPDTPVIEFGHRWSGNAAEELLGSADMVDLGGWVMWHERVPAQGQPRRAAVRTSTWKLQQRSPWEIGQLITWPVPGDPLQQLELFESLLRSKHSLERGS
jgi:broad specificity phosphatase PhoE